MQKFTDSCYRNVPSQYQYTFMDYSQAQQQQCQYDNYYCNNYMPYEYVSMGIQNNPPQYLPTYDPPADNTELNQLKRSLNMVQTRKMDKDRYQ